MTETLLFKVNCLQKFCSFNIPINLDRVHLPIPARSSSNLNLLIIEIHHLTDFVCRPAA